MSLESGDSKPAPSGYPSAQSRFPSWIRSRLPVGPGWQTVRDIVDTHRLHTVCQSASCPNMGECWTHGTATFMILGNVCTRSCGFCDVATGRPGSVDEKEPERVAHAIFQMGLRHAVITSVNRDDLPDGGSRIWANTIEAVRTVCPTTRVEVLTPDFKGRPDQLLRVLNARPHIFSHNLETVERLSRAVRPQASYRRSLEVLARATAEGSTVKSGFMLGLGELDPEIDQALHDLLEAGVGILTIGQYLQPSPKHLPINRWVEPSVFDSWAARARQIGFSSVVAGPLVRSSYHADEAARVHFLRSGQTRDPGQH